MTATIPSGDVRIIRAVALQQAWGEIVCRARRNSGNAIQEGFVPDDTDAAILAVNAELNELRSIKETHE